MATIQDEIRKAEDEIASFLQARMSVEDYHEAAELVNIFIDMNMAALVIYLNANKENYGWTREIQILGKEEPVDSEGGHLD
ncbi:MAG: hypothetical protein JHC33_08795 [Ignisphaera sp.]|nr:hypothetical protein [Ignisphaera sp.]